jgi:hypothetical protein
MAITLDGSNLTTSGVINRGTAIASTSGTSIDFAGIPIGASRITVMFNGVSTNAASDFLIQIGSGSFETTGYLSAASSGTTISTSTSAFILTNVTSAGSSQFGNVIFCNQTGNTWVESGTLSLANSTALNVSAGSKTTSGVLDRIRITTVSAATFDAGSINILYE